MMTRGKHEAGFTLLEILIAIGILAVGLVTIFTLFPIGLLAVKDTVDGSRGGSIAHDVRSELVAERADVQIANSGALTYDMSGAVTGSFFPAGPWHYPSNLRAFRDPVYQYVDAGGALHRRVVFDDRTMIPITLSGVFQGGTVTVSAASVTRESDLLKYYYDTMTSTFAPWDIYMRVQGRDYLLTDMTFDADGNVDQLAAAGLPDLGAAAVPFDVLLPAAMKEAPTDVPQGWAGAYADFSGSPYAIPASTANRSLGEYLKADAWIIVGGDMFRVATVTLTSGVPTSFTLAGPQPDVNLLGIASDPVQPFEIALPAVQFGAVTGTTQAISLLDPDPATTRGSYITSYLDSGASIEVVLDGGWGAMQPDPAGVGSQVLAVPATLNADTSGFIVMGDYLRVDGRDYEIINVAGTTITVNGTLPLATAASPKHFQIVLGWLTGVAGQVSEVARFPVTAVWRSGPGGPITSFEVGEDANGNLPFDFGLGGLAISYPVHILPRNYSQFGWQAAFNQKAPEGVFDNAADAVTAVATGLGPSSPAMPGVPFPVSASDVGYNGIGIIFRLFHLTQPTSAGTHMSADVQSMGSATSLQLSPGGAGMVIDGDRAPFMLMDRNDFIPDPTVIDDLTAGDGTLTSALQVDLLPATLTDNAVFLAPGVWVTVTDTTSGTSADGHVTGFDPATGILGIDNSAGVAVGSPVRVRIRETQGTPNANYPRGYGRFVFGQSIVAATTGAPPHRGFPYATTETRRFHLQIGDYIQPYDPTNVPMSTGWYAVTAIIDNRNGDPATDRDYIVLDRPYTGTGGDWQFAYRSPISPIYTAQISVFRRFRTRPLYAGAVTAFARGHAAAFGWDDVAGAPDTKVVTLSQPLPTDIKPGDFIRAEGDADHAVAGSTVFDLGLGDDIDGDWCWYMIDMISADRLSIVLASPYRGYPQTGANPVFQPASVSPAVVKTFDTLMGAF